MKMPKLKSHSGAKKRFRFSASGRIKFKKAGGRHLLAGMSSKRGRFLKRAGQLGGSDAKVIHKMLPYGN